MKEGLLLEQTMRCLLRFLLYIIPCVLIILPIRLKTGIPSFIFRKILHMIAFTCITLMTLVTESWQAAACASLVIAAAIYPLLQMVESQKWYSGLLVEKRPGEIKHSLLKLFVMFAGITAAAWGIFQKKEIAACSILMWGFGDGIAALIGIPYGRHKISWKGTDGRKSYEGTIAEWITSALVGILFYTIYAHAEHWLLPVLAAAAAGTLTELYSDSELDTVTVPVVIMGVLLFMMR